MSSSLGKSSDICKWKWQNRSTITPSNTESMERVFGSNTIHLESESFILWEEESSSSPLSFSLSAHGSLRFPFLHFPKEVFKIFKGKGLCDYTGRVVVCSSSSCPSSWPWPFVSFVHTNYYYYEKIAKIDKRFLFDAKNKMFRICVKMTEKTNKRHSKEDDKRRDRIREKKEEK